MSRLFYALPLAAALAGLFPPRGHAQVTVTGRVVQSENVTLGISGVAVQLKIRAEQGPGQGAITRNATTGTEGDYTFNNLPNNRFIEKISFNPPGRNPGAVGKIVTTANNVINIAVSRPTDSFEFGAYVSQFQTYRSLFYDEVSEGTSPDVLRQRFGTLLQQMPLPDDPARLPGLTPQQRAFAAKERNETLALYGLLPLGPEAVCPDQSCCEPDCCEPACKRRRRFFGFRSW